MGPPEKIPGAVDIVSNHVLELDLPYKGTFESDFCMAYAKLEGSGVHYYVQHLNILLGRQTTEPSSVDLPLGEDETIALLHASIRYNAVIKKFELYVYGKSGVIVQAKQIDIGQVVPLSDKTEIQIGKVQLTFMLPVPCEDDGVLDGGSPLTDISYISIGVDSPLELPQILDTTVVNIQEMEIDNMDSTSRIRNGIERIKFNGGEDENTFSQISEENGFFHKYVYYDYPFLDEIAENLLSIDPYEVVGLYRFKKEKPPFRIHILIAYLLKKSNTLLMSCEEIAECIAINFPYYSQESQDQGFKSNVKTTVEVLSPFRYSITRGWTCKESEYNIQHHVRDCIEEIRSLVKKFKTNTKGSKKKAKSDRLPELFDLYEAIDSYRFQDDEPPFPLHALSAHAIVRSEDKSLTLEEIFEHICQCFPYYRSKNDRTLKSEIRQELRDNKEFLCEPNFNRLFVWLFRSNGEYEAKVLKQIGATNSKGPSITDVTCQETEPIQSQQKRRRLLEEANRLVYKPCATFIPLFHATELIHVSTPKDNILECHPHDIPSLVRELRKFKTRQASEELKKELGIQISNMITRHLINPLRNPIPKATEKVLKRALFYLQRDHVKNLSLRVNRSFHMGNVYISAVVLDSLCMRL